MSPVQTLFGGLSGGTTVALAVLLPLFGTAFIGLLRARPNLREAATIVTGLLLFGLVVSLWPQIMAGENPRFVLSTPVPGIPLI